MTVHCPPAIIFLKQLWNCDQISLRLYFWTLMAILDLLQHSNIGRSNIGSWCSMWTASAGFSSMKFHILFAKKWPVIATMWCVQAAIEIARKDRTVLVVAHRLSTISRATRIYVLNQGSVQQQVNTWTLLVTWNLCTIWKLFVFLGNSSGAVKRSWKTVL